MPEKTSDISISRVAAEAEVSLGTVSRVFNGHPSVSEDLRRHVLTTGRRLGFVPKLPRRTLAVITGRHSPALPVGYVSIVTALVSRYAEARGYGVELIDVGNLDAVLQSHAHAAIGIVFDERIADLADIPNFPVVTLNHPMVDRGLHSLYTDHHAQAQVATEHLLEAGHREIAFLEIEPDEWGSEQRKRGYLDALAAAGIDTDPTLIQYSSQTPVYDILTRWARCGVTGILNFSEDAALEVIHILSNVLALTIGRDIATVTLEDLPIYQYLSPPQTTVRQPLEAIAEQAVACAIDAAERLQRGETPLPVVDQCFPTELIRRDSVGPPPRVAATA